MRKISVTNFGPIIEGTVELKPLTVFIGPNNTGKSYLATLIYALSVLPLPMAHPGFGFQESPDSLREGLYKWARASFTAKPNKVQRGLLKLGAPPVELESKIREAVKSYFAENLKLVFRKYWQADVSDLIRKSQSEQKGISLDVDRSPLRYKFESSNDELRCLDLSLSFQTLPLEMMPGFFSRKERIYADRHFWAELVWSALLSDAASLGFPDCNYLPAARSGILQGHRLLSASLIDRAPFAGIDPLEVPTLSGQVADFMRTLVLLERSAANKKLSEIAEFLEREALKGRIEVEYGETRHLPREMYYETAVGKFPLGRTSSMVSELTPVILYLKYVIRPNSLLIIEEPEAHLHPEVQRVLARALVKLVKAGVHVLITTHSDYLLGQLSNLVQLGALSEEERVRQGYDVEDYLTPKEVGAYLFESQEEGSVVKELSVSEEEGIDEDEFGKVAESLYDESVLLERKVLKQF